MPTITSLSKKLEMSADEALDYLRRLDFAVEAVDSELDDSQVEALMDIDEDPDAFDRMIEKKRKEEEAKAKKAKAAAKKKAPAKKKADAKKDDDGAGAAEPEQEATPQPEAPVATIITEDEPAAPVADILVESPVQDETVEVPAPVAPPVEEAAGETEPHEAEIVHKPLADTAPAAVAVIDAEPAEKPHTSKAEIIDESDPAAESAALLEAAVAHKHAEHGSGGALAEAERIHEEELLRKTQREKEKPAKPPIAVPDPDVVAQVIARDRERKMRKEQAPRERAERGAPRDANTGAPPAAGGVGSGRYKAPTTINFGPDARPGGGRGGEKHGASGKTAKQKQKKAERLRLLEDSLRREAAAAVKDFQSGSTMVGGKKKRRKYRGEDGEGLEKDPNFSGVITIEDTITAEQLANQMDMSVTELILELMDMNILITKNQTIDLDTVRQFAEKHGFEIEMSIPEEEEVFREEPDSPESLVRRSPVVTVMGHVDHGKTTLLDKIRSANVAEGEAGGITQHIAAYSVQLPNGKVTFLDTPGHEAFTQMRARGAHVTDVVVLVVAANDGVKPQTVEAIDHAKAAEVPIVVAINKCDMPAAQPDKVRQELTQYGLLDEAWGGKTIMKNISAKMGEGVDDLMELLVLQSDMMDLKANPSKRARGAVIESEITVGQGPVAWVLVQNGTLRVGDAFLAGSTYGHVRNMTNSRGEEIQEAGPSTPVVVTGFSSPPDAGDVFIVTADERAARGIAEKRLAAARLKRGPAVKHMTLEDFHARVSGSDQKTLNIIIKADVQGSADVLTTSFGKIGNEEAKVCVVHAGVGGVNESDVLLASASDAVIIGFHVTANPKAKKLAEQEGVDIRTYRIIYEALDEVKNALEGLLSPDKKEVTFGHVEVRRVFRSSALGNIAGCYVLDGEAQRGAKARLVRDSVVIYDGKIESLRREKDDARSVLAGFECGLKLERYEDVQVGDIVEVYRIEEVAKLLG